MKKIVFIFTVLLLLFIGTLAKADTYTAILAENGYTDIIGNYVSEPQLKDILSIIFKSSINYETEKYGNATGEDFFNMVEGELDYKTFMISNKEIYKSRALTFIGLCELLDFYFPEISRMHNITSAYGRLSKDVSGYTLTYGEGEVVEFKEFDYFRVTDSLYEVNVIFKDGRIIDVCLVDHNAPISRLEEKREVVGKVYLLYDKGIIIEDDGKLYEYPIASSFRFINEKYNQEIVLILGNYKKNKDMACIAIGRT